MWETEWEGIAGGDRNILYPNCCSGYMSVIKTKKIMLLYVQVYLG